MNKHVSGAEREVAPSAQTPAPEFDAMTWGAEEALKAMVAYQVESLRFMRDGPIAISSSCGTSAIAATGRRLPKCSSPGSRIARPIAARS